MYEEQEKPGYVRNFLYYFTSICKARFDLIVSEDSS